VENVWEFIFTIFVVFAFTSITIVECNEGKWDTANAYCNSIASVGQVCVPAGNKGPKSPLCKCVIEEIKKGK
jgi:hypothetical protein